MEMVVLWMPGASYKKIKRENRQQNQDTRVLGPVLVSLVSWPKPVPSFS